MWTSASLHSPTPAYLAARGSPAGSGGHSGGGGVPTVTPDHASFVQLLDTLGEGIVLFDGRGRISRHTNAALRRMLCEPPPGRLWDELILFAAHLAHARERSQITTRDLQVGEASLRLRGSHLRFNPLGGGSAILIAVERRMAELSTPAELCTRWGLTRAEAKVALLLAAGKTDAEVASSLSISRHTARHHSEAIRRKLGVRSRTEAAAMLWSAPPPAAGGS